MLNWPQSLLCPQRQYWQPWDSLEITSSFSNLGDFHQPLFYLIDQLHSILLTILLFRKLHFLFSLPLLLWLQSLFFISSLYELLLTLSCPSNVCISLDFCPWSLITYSVWISWAKSWGFHSTKKIPPHLGDSLNQWFTLRGIVKFWRDNCDHHDEWGKGGTGVWKMGTRGIRHPAVLDGSSLTTKFECPFWHSCK